MSEEVVEESDSHPRCPECPSHESGIEIPDVDDVWIGCDECNNWFHCACANVLNAEAIDKWYCPDCCLEKVGLQVQYKPEPRKSGRPKNKHDYAALDDGIALSKRHIDRLPTLNITPENFKRIKGSELTLEWLENTPDSMTEPILIENPEGLDMTMPHPDISVDEIANLVGRRRPVEVIDCATQQLSKYDWTMGEWADHYHRRPNAPELDKTLNVISLEVSDTKLAQRIIPPKFVRDLDWVGNFWPKNKYNEAPHVLLYVLMSLGGSFTDWHIDFAGSSVFYHVLRGTKIFYLVKPTEHNINQYTRWSESPNQSVQWFGDLASETFKVELNAGNTLIIPTGWMHAVYTPNDTLVCGGNFVHSYGIPGQQRIIKVEIDTKVPLKFRFPSYQTLCWYVGASYVQMLKSGKSFSVRLLENISVLADFLISLAYKMESPVQDCTKPPETINRLAKGYRDKVPTDKIKCEPFDLAAALKIRVEEALRKCPNIDAEKRPQNKRRRSTVYNEYDNNTVIVKTEDPNGAKPMELSNTQTETTNGAQMENSNDVKNEYKNYLQVENPHNTTQTEKLSNIKPEGLNYVKIQENADKESWGKYKEQRTHETIPKKMYRPILDEDGCGKEILHSAPDGEDVEVQLDSWEATSWKILDPNKYLRKTNIKMYSVYNFVKRENNN